MTDNIILTCCASEVAQCTTPEEVLNTLDKYELKNEEWVYCCILASCMNRKEINLLEKRLSAAEHVRSM